MKIRMLRKVTLALSLVLCGVFTFSSCDKNNDDGGTTPFYRISGNASGSQVTPAVSGSGTGTITGGYDPGTKVFNYTTTWTGLTGAPVSGGFYIGAAGTTGTIIGNPWTFGGSTTATGSFMGSMMLTPDQEAQLIAGGWYYTYTTTANPGGEIRGQIIATQ